MRIHQQYQPAHQMHPIIAKLDHLLDMMESRMDAAERRIDNLRPPTQPEPKPLYVSRRLDPPDRRPRTGYPPIRYRDRAQDARPRRRCGYAERGHLFDRGDQRIQLGFDRHPIHATKPHRSACWDPPTQQQDRCYLTFDHRPRRVETCWDRPHHQEEVRAPRGQSTCHQPHHAADQPPGSPTCWDPSGLRTQQRYPADDISFERFGSDDLCWGRWSSLSHNRYIECSIPSPVTEKKATPSLRSLGSRCEPDWYQVSVGMRDQEGDETSDSSSLDDQIAYSCIEARVYDCVCDHVKGEEELDGFEDSIVETAAKKTMDRDAESLDTTSVSNVAIRLPSRNHGSRERRDTGPDDQQVIYCEDTTCSPDMSKEKEEDELLDDEEEDDSTNEGKKVVDSSNAVRVPSKNDVGNCWGKKGGGAYTALHEIFCVCVDLSVGNITSMNNRSMSLATDTRLIPPRNDTPCLSILGGMDKLFVLAWNFAEHIVYSLLIFDGGYEGRLSAVRCAFDPGGEASQKILLSIIVVASWFPP